MKRSEVEKIRLRNKKEFHENMVFNVQFGISHYVELRNVLITTAVLSFTLLSPFFVKEQLINLMLWQKGLLIIAWCFSFISILAGVIQMWVDVRFHEKEAQRASLAKHEYSQQIENESVLHDIGNKVEGMYWNFEYGSNKLALLTQSVTWLLSLLLLLILVISIVLK